MSDEQLKAFIEKVKADTSLQEKLKAAKSPEEVVSIAKEHGHDFGTEHISQLTEEELEGVAGDGSLVNDDWRCVKLLSPPLPPRPLSIHLSDECH